MWNPLAWTMEAAAIIAIVLLDVPDFVLIVALLLGECLAKLMPGFSCWFDPHHHWHLLGLPSSPVHH